MHNDDKSVSIWVAYVGHKSIDYKDRLNWWLNPATRTRIPFFCIPRRHTPEKAISTDWKASKLVHVLRNAYAGQLLTKTDDRWFKYANRTSFLLAISLNVCWVSQICHYFNMISAFMIIDEVPFNPDMERKGHKI
jgi:hypothetical protein